MKNKRGIKLDKSDSIQCIERCIRLASGEIIYRVICDECPACDDSPAKEYYTDWQGNVIFDASTTDWNTCWYVDLSGRAGGTSAIEVNGVSYSLGGDYAYVPASGTGDLIHNQVNVVLANAGIPNGLAQYYHDGSKLVGLTINCMGSDIESIRFIGSSVIGGDTIPFVSAYLHPDFPDSNLPAVGRVYYTQFCEDCVVGPPDLTGSLPCNSVDFKRGDCLSCSSNDLYCFDSDVIVTSIIVNGELLEANYPIMGIEAAYLIEVFLQCSKCDFIKMDLPDGRVCLEWSNCPEDLTIEYYNSTDPSDPDVLDSTCEGDEDVLLVKECNSEAILEGIQSLSEEVFDFDFQLLCTDTGEEVLVALSNGDGSVVNLYGQVECGYRDRYCASVSEMLTRHVISLEIDGVNSIVFGWDSMTVEERIDYLESELLNYPSLFFDSDLESICSYEGSVNIDYVYQTMIPPVRQASVSLVWEFEVICPSGCVEVVTDVSSIEIYNLLPFTVGLFFTLPSGDTALYYYPLGWETFSSRDKLIWYSSIAPPGVEVIEGGQTFPNGVTFVYDVPFSVTVINFRQAPSVIPSSISQSSDCVGLLESGLLVRCEDVSVKKRWLCSTVYGNIIEVLVVRNGVPDNPVYVTPDNSIVTDLGPIRLGRCPQSGCLDCDSLITVDTVCHDSDQTLTTQGLVGDPFDTVVLAGTPIVRKTVVNRTPIGCDCVAGLTSVRYYSIFNPEEEFTSTVSFSSTCNSSSEILTRCLADGSVIRVITVDVLLPSGVTMINTYYDDEGNPIPEPVDELFICNPTVHPIEGCVDIEGVVYKGTLHLLYDEGGNAEYSLSTFYTNEGGEFLLEDNVFSTSCVETEECSLTERTICYDFSTMVLPCNNLSFDFEGVVYNLCEFDNLIIPVSGNIFTRGGIRSDQISSLTAEGFDRHINASNLSITGFDPNDISSDLLNVSLNPFQFGGNRITTSDPARILFSGHVFGLSGTAPSIQIEADFVTVGDGFGIAVYDPSQDLILDLLPGYVYGSWDYTNRNVHVSLGGESNFGSMSTGAKLWEVDTSGVSDLAQLVIYVVGFDGFGPSLTKAEEIHNLRVNGVLPAPYLCDISSIAEIAQYLTNITGSSWEVFGQTLCTTTTKDWVFGEIICDNLVVLPVETQEVVIRDVPLVKLACADELSGGGFSKDKVCFEYESEVYEGWEYESLNPLTGEVRFRKVEDRDRTLSLSEGYLIVDCPCEEADSGVNLAKGLKILTDTITDMQNGGGSSSSSECCVQVTKIPICFESGGVVYKGWEIEGFTSDGQTSFREAATVDRSMSTDDYQIVDCPCDDEPAQAPLAIDDLGYTSLVGESLIVNVSLNDVLCPNGEVTEFRLVSGSESNVVVVPNTNINGVFGVTPITSGPWSFEYDIYCDGVYSGQTALVTGDSIASIDAEDDSVGDVQVNIPILVDTKPNDLLCPFPQVTTWEVVPGSEVNATVLDNPIDLDGVFEVTVLSPGPFSFDYELVCDGTPSGETATVTGNGVGPVLNITKEIVSSPPYIEGSTVTYSVVISNVGTSNALNVVVSDTLSPITVVSDVNGILSGPFTLPAGAIYTATYEYQITNTDAVAGNVTNVVSYTSDGGYTGQDTEVVQPVIAETPSISLLKQAVLNGDGDVGDTITYTFTVENTGNVPLSNITISDPNVTVLGGPISLTPGQIDNSSFTATHVITQQDSDNGEVRNQATVFGTSPLGTVVNDISDDPSTPAVDDETVIDLCPFELPLCATWNDVNDVLYATIDFNVSFNQLGTPRPGMIKSWNFNNGLILPNGDVIDLWVDLVSSPDPNDVTIISANDNFLEIPVPNSIGQTWTSVIRLSFDEAALSSSCTPVWRILFEDIDGESEQEGVCFDNTLPVCWGIIPQNVGGRLTEEINGSETCFFGQDNGNQNNPEHSVGLIYFNLTSVEFGLTVRANSSTGGVRQFFPQTFNTSHPISQHVNCQQPITQIIEITSCSGDVSYTDQCGNPIDPSLITISGVPPC